MYQAITVKYFGPGNVRGSRYKARAAVGSKSYTQIPELSHEQNVIRVAKEFAWLKGWAGKYYGGQMHNGDYVFVVSRANTSMEPYFVILPEHL